jgi:hypothetical protein
VDSQLLERCSLAATNVRPMSNAARANRDHQAAPDSQAVMATQDDQATMETLETQDRMLSQQRSCCLCQSSVRAQLNQEEPVAQDRRDQTDQLAMLDVQAAVEDQAKWERLDHRDHQDSQATQATTDHQDHQETCCQEPVPQPDHQDQMDNVETQDEQDPTDLPARKETMAPQAHQDRVDGQDPTVKLDDQEQLVTLEITAAREAATLAHRHVWPLDTSQSIDINQSITLICTIMITTCIVSSNKSRLLVTKMK